MPDNRSRTMNKNKSNHLSAEDEDRKMRKLFVDKLSSSITEDDIFAVFSKHGEIEEVAKYQDRRAPHRYFAFVVYKTAKDCVKATYDPCPIIRGKKCACMLAAIGKQFSGYKFFVQKGLLTEDQKEAQKEAENAMNSSLNQSSNKNNKKPRQRRHKNKNNRTSQNQQNQSQNQQNINIHIPSFKDDNNLSARSAIVHNSEFVDNSPVQFESHPSWHSHFDSNNTSQSTIVSNGAPSNQRNRNMNMSQFQYRYPSNTRQPNMNNAAFAHSYNPHIAQQPKSQNPPTANPKYNTNILYEQQMQRDSTQRDRVSRADGVPPNRYRSHSTNTMYPSWQYQQHSMPVNSQHAQYCAQAQYNYTGNAPYYHSSGLPAMHNKRAVVTSQYNMNQNININRRRTQSVNGGFEYYNNAISQNMTIKSQKVQNMAPRAVPTFTQSVSYGHIERSHSHSSSHSMHSVHSHPTPTRQTLQPLPPQNDTKSLQLPQRSHSATTIPRNYNTVMFPIPINDIPSIPSPDLLADNFAEMGIEIGCTPSPPPLLLNSAAKPSLDIDDDGLPVFDQLKIPKFNSIEAAKKATDKELEAGFTMIPSPTPSVPINDDDDN